jgi:hypothetical protein
LVSSAKRAQLIEKLADKIGAGSTDAIIREHVRTAARAEFDLAEIRQIKTALINWILMFGTLDVPRQPVYPSRVPWQILEAMVLTKAFPRPFDAASTMPPMQAERTAEAVRRALPELLRLDRYEQRAAVRRRWALRAVIGRINLSE